MEFRSLRYVRDRFWTRLFADEQYHANTVHVSQPTSFPADRLQPRVRIQTKYSKIHIFLYIAYKREPFALTRLS